MTAARSVWLSGKTSRSICDFGDRTEMLPRSSDTGIGLTVPALELCFQRFGWRFGAVAYRFLDFFSLWHDKVKQEEFLVVDEEVVLYCYQQFLVDVSDHAGLEWFIYIGSN